MNSIDVVSFALSSSVEEPIVRSFISFDIGENRRITRKPAVVKYEHITRVATEYKDEYGSDINIAITNLEQHHNDNILELYALACVALRLILRQHGVCRSIQMHSTNVGSDTGLRLEAALKINQMFAIVDTYTVAYMEVIQEMKSVIEAADRLWN